MRTPCSRRAEGRVRERRGGAGNAVAARIEDGIEEQWVMRRTPKAGGGWMRPAARLSQAGPQVFDN